MHVPGTRRAVGAGLLLLVLACGPLAAQAQEASPTPPVSATPTEREPRQSEAQAVQASRRAWTILLLGGAASAAFIGLTLSGFFTPGRPKSPDAPPPA